MLNTGVMSLASVIIVEDNKYLRSLTIAALESAEIEVVLATDKVRDAISAVESQNVEVAILDLYLGPGPTGLDLAKVLRQMRPQIGLVFLTSFSDPRLLLEHPKLPKGSLYLTKSRVANLAEIVTAILRAKYAPNALSNTETQFEVLTDSQILVWRMISQGLTNSEIARQLGVSEKAIEKNITKIISDLEIAPGMKNNPRVKLASEFTNRAGQQIWPRG